MPVMKANTLRNNLHRKLFALNMKHIKKMGAGTVNNVKKIAEIAEFFFFFFFGGGLLLRRPHFTGDCEGLCTLF